VFLGVGQALGLEHDAEHLHGEPEHAAHAAGGEAGPENDHFRVVGGDVALEQVEKQHEEAGDEDGIHGQADRGGELTELDIGRRGGGRLRHDWANETRRGRGCPPVFLAAGSLGNDGGASQALTHRMRSANCPFLIA